MSQFIFGGQDRLLDELERTFPLPLSIRFSPDAEEARRGQILEILDRMPKPDLVISSHYTITNAIASILDDHGISLLTVFTEKNRELARKPYFITEIDHEKIGRTLGRLIQEQLDGKCPSDVAIPVQLIDY